MTRQILAANAATGQQVIIIEEDSAVACPDAGSRARNDAAREFTYALEDGTILEKRVGEAGAVIFLAPDGAAYKQR